MNKLKEKVDALPEAPGVYIYKDTQGKVIYIGKAKSLKKRVQSYFTRYLSDKTQALVSQIRDIEYITSPSESQAQLLEASLIKKKLPRYNISLKDDKSFPLIRITDERYPIVSICRRKKVSAKEKGKSIYFGPYTNAKLLRQALKVIRQIFGFRSCKKLPKQPCLYFRLRLCPGPCIGNISPRRYKEIIEDIRMFLESKYEQLVKRLSAKMNRAAKEKRFEVAAKIRDQIAALGAINREQSYFSSLDELEDLKKLIGLDNLPVRIEAFDISNISGKEATGSMVSFYKGIPDKNNYRRFRIKTIRGIDDYAMLREVVHRRYLRLKEEKLVLPDLILIDGGKQHLLAAGDELKKLKINLPIVSIAKEEENIYIKDKQEPIKLSTDTPALNLIRRVRDEAHRFARRYHHLLHKKKILEE